MRQQKMKLASYLPLGKLTSRSMLLKQGFTSHSIDNHLKSGALEKIVKGIYMRQESKLSWRSVISPLPGMIEAPVSVGGLTALELQGFAQYLPLSGKRKIHLYSPVPCPAWLKGAFKQIVDAELHWHRTARLWVTGWPEKPMMNEQIWQEDMMMPVAAPEQAVFEMLTLLPDEMSFEHAEQLMQGLTQLSPKKLGLLLNSCRSVKVKRLFFWLADRFDYPWCGRLDVNDYDLGSGKRVIAKAGKLDSRYGITIPQEFYRENAGG